MQIQTTRFGLIEVPEDTIYTFAEPIPGFPKAQRFAILKDDRVSPFQWLQGLDPGDPAFLVVDPLLFVPNYLVEVTPEEIRPIALEKIDTGFVLAILTVPADPRGMTANLRAPLIFNPAARRACQLILSRTDYPVRFGLFESSPPTAVANDAKKS